MCNQPQSAKTFLLTCASNKDSNQPAQPRSLIRVFAVHINKLCIFVFGYLNWVQWSAEANRCRLHLPYLTLSIGFAIAPETLYETLLEFVIAPETLYETILEFVIAPEALYETSIEFIIAPEALYETIIEYVLAPEALHETILEFVIAPETLYETILVCHCSGSTL